MNCIEEAAQIKAILQDNLPPTWDGKQCITEMHLAQAANWRQMEWIGWYFEWKAFHLLTASLGGGQGPLYGTMVFDYQNQCVWDFKSHVNNAGKPWAILNDAQATYSCVAEHGQVGYIIANGPAFYNDIQQTFKKWHEDFKGDPSKYVLKGIESGRSSRRRKTVFMLSDILMFQLDAEALEQGKQEGWLKGFQSGMPNSNGKPRPGKMQIHLGKMPTRLIF